MSASLPVYILTHELQFDTHTALRNVHCKAGSSGVRRHEELTQCDGLFLSEGQTGRAEVRVDWRVKHDVMGILIELL